MQLSEHFTLAQLMRSDTATRLGIDNTPPERHIENLKLLCTHVLEPVWFYYEPLRISLNSGYRSLSLNMAINPMTSTINKLSQHCLGLAVDFEVESIPNVDLALWCEKNLPIFDQLILEFYTPGVPTSGWVHVSYVKDKPRKDVMTATRVNGKIVYTSGINR